MWASIFSWAVEERVRGVLVLALAAAVVVAGVAALAAVAVLASLEAAGVGLVVEVAASPPRRPRCSPRPATLAWT